MVAKCLCFKVLLLHAEGVFPHAETGGQQMQKLHFVTNKNIFLTMCQVKLGFARLKSCLYHKKFAYNDKYS